MVCGSRIIRGLGLASISLPSGLGGWVCLEIGMSQAADSLVPAEGAPLCAGVALPGAANWLRNPKPLDPKSLHGELKG